MSMSGRFSISSTTVSSKRFKYLRDERVLGVNTSVSNSVVSDVWLPSGVKGWPSAAGKISIQSLDTDDSLAGVGAQKIIVKGLSPDWEPVEEIVDMDGTTAVLTVNNYIRLNEFEVHQTGDPSIDDGTGNGANVGVIDATLDGKLQSRIGINDAIPLAKGLISHFTIPDSSDGYVNFINLNVDTNLPATFYALSRDNNRSGAPIVVRGFFTAITGTVSVDLSEDPVLLTQRTDFWFAAIGSVGATEVQVNYNMHLESLS